MIREVVHHEMAFPFWIASINGVEEGYEVVASAGFGGEAKQLAASNIVGAHQAQRAMSDVLEFASNRLTRLHRDVGMETLQRLNARFLVEANDVLRGRRVVIDPEHIVPLGAEFVVLRRPPHRLPMGVQARVPKDTPDRSVADLEALGTLKLDEIGQRKIETYKARKLASG